MKRLILIRHAKSSWEEPVEDKLRILTKRGINDANLVATSFLPNLPENSIIFSSPAKRAKDTAIIFMEVFSFPFSDVTVKEELYTFNDAQLEKSIKNLRVGYENVILFGHNEAITNFVNKFGSIFIDNVPTSGLVSIVFKTDNWETITKGTTEHVLFPRDLKL